MLLCRSGKLRRRRLLLLRRFVVHGRLCLHFLVCLVCLVSLVGGKCGCGGSCGGVLLLLLRRLSLFGSTTRLAHRWKVRTQ